MAGMLAALAEAGHYAEIDRRVSNIAAALHRACRTLAHQ
jgi:hypothetical protein